MTCPSCHGKPIVYGDFAVATTWRGGTITTPWVNHVALSMCIRCRGSGTVGQQAPADHLF